jgi:glycosyltransferase involved in cell wall biosynthesis
VLFIHGSELGFKTSGHNLERACAERADVDAVHVRVPMRGLAKLLSAPPPVPLGGLDQGAYRWIRAWGRTLRGLLRGPLPLDRFDVVHIMPQQRAWVVTELAGRTPTKFAVNIDAVSGAYDRAFGLTRPRWAWEVEAERRILRAADLVACWSRWSSDAAVLDEGVDPARVVLHKQCAFVDPSGIRTHDDSPPRGTPGAPPVRLVFVGNDWERKGGPRLIRWHQERFRDRAEVHVCSAKAPQDRTLQGVVWHGATPHDRLMTEILPAADVLVMPTRVDTFLIAAQEAQAVGLPVITSRLAALPEVVRDGRTGLLCAPDDDAAFVAAIGRLIDDAPLRRAMGHAATEHARTHMSGRVWHGHLVDQLVALADGRPTRYAPEGVDVRRDDGEAKNPTSAAESAAMAREAARS